MKDRDSDQDHTPTIEYPDPEINIYDRLRVKAISLYYLQAGKGLHSRFHPN